MLELGGRVPMTLGIGGPTRAVCIVSGVAESPAGLRDVAHIVTTKNALPSLLAMARELIRIRSARGWLEANSGRPRAFWMPENIIAACEAQGWRDPLSPRAKLLAVEAELGRVKAELGDLRREHLRASRLLAGLSLRPAAELLGLSPQRLSDLEHGRGRATNEEWAILFGRLDDAANTGAA
jgi:hypothetical protein